MKQYILIMLLTAVFLQADDDRVAPVNNTLYAKECGACHFAYQPSFLGPKSWREMMNTLSDHFGTNAMLLPEDAKTIKNYLLRNAGRKESITLRITKLRWFEEEHREIPRRFIQQEAVQSLINCAKCHQKASRGLYDDDDISIPGYGDWDD